MFGLTNFYGILVDYIKDMSNDLKICPFIIIFIIQPFVIAFIFLMVIPSELFSDFNKNLITVNSILIPLLINLLMIVYYSLERIQKDFKDALSKDVEINLEIVERKTDYINHINSTITVTTIISLILLCLALIVQYPCISFGLEAIIFVILSYLLINLEICISRIYLLIKLDIVELNKSIETRKDLLTR
jgi:hypothetical protein